MEVSELYPLITLQVLVAILFLSFSYTQVKSISDQVASVAYYPVNYRFQGWS